MTTYKCEEISLCTNFQSAICLHCNRRLCVSHIAEHNQTTFNNITNLSNEFEITSQQINEESLKRRNICNNILTSIDQWRRKQIEKIEKIYANHLKCIESQQETLNNEEIKLYEQLERNVRQTIEEIQRQQNAPIEIINHIQQTINKVREDNKSLKWNLSTPLPLSDIDHSSLTLPSISIPKSNKNKPRKKKKKTSPKRPSTKVVKLQKGRSLKRLVEMFANVTSIAQAKKDITVYIQRQGVNFQLPILVCSYLTAWYRKSILNEKVFLLNEHITIIQKYLTKCKSDFDVLIGIQAFFYNQKIKENNNEMMTFLLQFFLNHHCINQNQILNWYNNENENGYHGFNHAMQLATPFIKSLSTVKTDNNVQTVSTNSTFVGQSNKTEIKQESIELT